MKKLILTALLLLNASPTFAACDMSSLTGTWTILGATNNEVYGFQGVGKGTVVISSIGIINATKSSITYIAPNGTQATAMLSGKVSTNSQCSITASVVATKTAYTNGSTYTVYGQLNTGKNMISSIYRSTDYDVGMINWVKR